MLYSSWPVACVSKHPLHLFFGGLIGGYLSTSYGKINCEADCQNELSDTLQLLNLEYIKCKANHPDPKDTGEQQIGTSPE